MAARRPVGSTTIHGCGTRYGRPSWPGILGEAVHPAHPPGRRIGVVAELVRHPADAATHAKLLPGATDCRGYRVGGRGVGWLQSGGEQRLAPPASFRFCRVMATCVEVDISHHPGSRWLKA